MFDREPDIPTWAPLLYQLQLLDIRDKPDPMAPPIPDRIRIGNQKRERGNFHFQREEYSMAARAYCMALDMLTTRTRGKPVVSQTFSTNTPLDVCRYTRTHKHTCIHTHQDWCTHPLVVITCFRKTISTFPVLNYMIVSSLLSASPSLH